MQQECREFLQTEGKVSKLVVDLHFHVMIQEMFIIYLLKFSLTMSCKTSYGDLHFVLKTFRIESALLKRGS